MQQSWHTHIYLQPPEGGFIRTIYKRLKISGNFKLPSKKRGEARLFVSQAGFISRLETKFIKAYKPSMSSMQM